MAQHTPPALLPTINPLYRRPVVEQATGDSRSTLYRKIKNQLFPRPIQIGGDRVAWPANEVQASRIAAWHLSEARRFFGELALPVELANAARLDACGAAELSQSLAIVTGQNIGVIRSYPSNKFVAISGNTVYSFAQNSKMGTPCEIFFEVNQQNVIVSTSYKGEACNSFYNETLKPKS